MVAPAAPPDGKETEEDCSWLDSLDFAKVDVELQEADFAPPPPECLEETVAFFSDDGPLKKLAEIGGRSYEPRPQQSVMANEIASAFEKGRNLCVEAPTGVGKSFAYLIPAIYAALSMKKPVLITTETLNLQEQLVYKDLPLLAKLLNLDLKFVLAKGRGNYVCKRRLLLARGGHRDDYLPSGDMLSAVERLADWADKTEDGSKYDIDFPVDNELWACVCSEAANCSGPSCKFFRNCFYWKARRSWEDADIVVANHALFFIDLKIRALEQQEASPLPNYGAVVFDEAHTLEDSAASHLGLSLRSGALRYFLNRLYNPATGKGLLLRAGEASLQLRATIARVQDAATEYFLQFQEAVRDRKDSVLRIVKPGRFSDNLSAQLGEVAKMLREYIAEQTDADFRTELQSMHERCLCFQEEIAGFTEMAWNEHVYWAEGKLSSVSRTQMIELDAAPLNVAALLHNILFNGKKSVILTSATLAVNGSLDYFFNRVGFGNGEGIVLDSPFDYAKQVKLYLPRSMPMPTDEEYYGAVCDEIIRFLKFTNGRAFVLFTSYGMLRTCAEELKDEIRDLGLNLLVHGGELSRSAMLEQFKTSSVPSVLFGAASFWTGVDVPGDALSNVMITKLPFAVPSHPLIEARLERIRLSGGEPFRDYSIPDAVLKFRQGVGRLIRSKTDTGIVVVLDRRIVTKSYGSRFLDSIPPCPVEYF